MAESKVNTPLELCLPSSPAADEGLTDTQRAQAEVLVLFDSCGASLNRYVRSAGIEPAAAQDVVQEVFLALFHHVRRGRPRGNLKGWLFKVAHNLSLKHRHKTKRRQAGFVPEMELAEQVVDPSLNPEQRLTEEQRRLRLRAVMDALPERDRQCLYLQSEGLRYREIAQVVGMSLGAVAKSLSRSLARLANVHE